MLRFPTLRFAAVVLALLAGGCAGGTPTRPEPGYPPEAPRQPERLVVAAPDIADPLAWWRVNIQAPLPADVYATAAQAQAASQAVEIANEVRIDHGLEPVERLPELDRVAQAHARDQAIRDYWSHWTPEGLGSAQRMLAGGNLVVTVGGENSSIVTPEIHTPGQIVQGWLGHVGHRELLLSSKVRYTGMGVYNYGPGEWTFYVQLLVDLSPE